MSTTELPQKHVVSREVGDELALREFLRDRDVPCPLCGYDLRGLTIPRCPECGQPLKLGVGLAEPVLKTWIVMIVPLLAWGGVGFLFWTIMLRVGEWPRTRDGFQRVLIVLLAVSPVFAVVGLTTRKKFLRMPIESQWSIAMTTAVAGVLGVIYVLAQIR